MIIIGITGTTGAGKTTALMELNKLGGHIIDADAVYHQLLESNVALRKELEDRFGPLTDETGTFQRKRLGSIVFGDLKALADLNRITIRYIGAAIEAELERAKQAGCPAAAIDAIRLFESGLAERCTVTLAITAPPKVRVRRIMARESISEEYAWSRVKAQQAEEFYIQRSDYVLVNDCTSAAEFAAQAASLFESILRRHKQ